MEKIHRRHGFRWVHPVHEVLEYRGEEPDTVVWVNGLVLNHYPDLTKPRAQYLPLLELSAAENPEDDRVAFWLGREYMYHGRYDESIATLKRHLALPTALWEEERCASMRLIARCFEQKGDRREAKRWLFRAIAECAGVREPYFQMALLGYHENDWPLVYLMTEKALEIQKKTGSYLLEPEAWGYSLYDLGAICCYYLGLYDKAYHYAKLAYEKNPEDERLKQNLELIAHKVRSCPGGEHAR
jgi:tetratricopeptide (TPR) repeat protein